MAGGARRRVRLRLSPAGAALLVAGAVLAIIARGVFVAAHRQVGWAVACFVVALLLEPLVSALDQHVPRAVAVIIVLLAVVATVGLLTAGVLRDLGDSVDTLRRTAPEAAAGLEQRSPVARDLRVRARVDTFIDSVDQRVRGDAVSRAVGTIPTYVVTGILMLFLLAYWKRFLIGALGQITDHERRARARIVVARAIGRGRGYLLAALFQGLVIGVNAWIVYRLVDLPAALVLALLTGVWSAIPYLGVLIGGLPALLLATGLDGASSAVPVAVALVGLQLIEALLVRGNVDRRTVRVGPTMPLVVVLVGFELYGIGGAVYGMALLVIALAAADAVADLQAEAAGEAVGGAPTKGGTTAILPLPSTDPEAADEALAEELDDDDEEDRQGDGEAPRAGATPPAGGR
jgi:predicted PurR-regulated permease PerM